MPKRPLSPGFSVATPRFSLKKAERCTFILVSRTLTHLTSFGTFTWHLNQQNKLQKWSDFIVQPNITTRSLAASDFSVKRQKKKWPEGTAQRRKLADFISLDKVYAQIRQLAFLLNRNVKQSSTLFVPSNLQKMEGEGGGLWREQSWCFCDGKPLLAQRS